MSGLEQQLRALMEAHDLTSISVGMIGGAPWPQPWPNCYAQGSGMVGTSGHEGLTLAEALSYAITDLNVKRGASVAIADLPAMDEVAA